MTTIKNFEAFKKSLLSATNGTMVESFDASIMFAGSDYQSYRIYVDDVHYYNMFVIYYSANNSYDVSLETSCCGTSTMSRTTKTQKALIESVVAWINNNDLDAKTISEDSENYTDRCETTETADEEPVKDAMEVKQELNARFGKEQYFDADTLQPNKIAKIENINHCPNQNTCCIVSPLAHCNYNYKSGICIEAHKNFINACEQVHKQMKAKNNPEWHHVSLATLANIDFDMLDKKRQVYLKAHRELKRTLADLSKCKTAHTYEARARKFMCDMISQYYDNEISYSMRKYLDLQLSMSNVINGVWSSYVEPAMGLHESRRYSRPTLRY